MTRRRRIVVTTASVGALAVLAVGGWFAYEAQQAGRALERAASSAQLLQRALVDGDTPAAERALADMQSASVDARSRTDGFLWAVASHSPWAGDDVDAVRTVAGVVDRISADALPPIVDAAGALDLRTFSPTDGRLDVEALERLGPVIDDANSALDAAGDELGEVDPDRLVDALRGPVVDLGAKLREAVRITDTTGTALSVLPAMLGGEGERSYLALFQNNAEIRSSGGIPGALAVIRADEGTLSLDEQRTAAEIGQFRRPVLDLTEDERQLYTNKLGVYMADVTFTPDFPRTAELAQAMWAQRYDEEVDGVLSVDPVALSYLLEGTGPISLRDGSTLTSSNAVDVLLNQAYVDTPDAQQQNDFFADAAKRTFEAVAGGQGDPRAVVEAIVRAASERRLSVWSADAGEQKVLASTIVGGTLPTGEGGDPELGVYLNDATGAKMQYYLDYDLEVASTDCTDVGSQTLATTLTMTSNAPGDAAQLPESIIGPGFGAPPGSMLMNARVYASSGGSFGRMTINGDKVIYDQARHEGRPVAIVTILLRPGETQELTVAVITGPGTRGDAQVSLTPGVRSGGTPTTVGTTC